MQVKLIMALGRQNELGYRGGLPWKLAGDLRHFRQLTLHHSILMGHRTFASIGHALSERRNLVLSRCPGLELPGAEVVNSWTEAMERLATVETELWVIGGATVYRTVLQQQLADQLWLTRVDYTGPADVYCSELSLQQWEVLSAVAYPADALNSHAFTIYHLQRLPA